MYAQRESNPHGQLRRLVFYPLNYGRVYKEKGARPKFFADVSSYII